MSDNLLQKRLQSISRSSEAVMSATTHPIFEETDDCVSFGFLRGVRDRAIMLELRKKDGNVKALGYSWLSQADFDPSIGITLHFGSQQVKILGRNLNAEHRPNVRLFAGILRHRVPWIQEADEHAEMKSGDHDCVIETIEW